MLLKQDREESILIQEKEDEANVTFQQLTGTFFSGGPGKEPILCYFPASDFKRQYNKSMNCLCHITSAWCHYDWHFCRIWQGPHQIPTLLTYLDTVSLHGPECKTDIKKSKRHYNNYLVHHRIHKTVESLLVRISCDWTERWSSNGRAIMCYLVIS